MSPTAQSLLRAPRIPLPLMALAQQRPVPGDSGASELEAPGLTAAWVWTQAVWSEKLHARESADGFVSIHHTAQIPVANLCGLVVRPLLKAALKNPSAFSGPRPNLVCAPLWSWPQQRLRPLYVHAGRACGAGLSVRTGDNTPLPP
eukprot:2122388-Pleurochrysis_carterae.AAC.1